MAEYRLPPWHIEQVPWGDKIDTKIVSADGAVVAVIVNGPDTAGANTHANLMVRAPEMKELLLRFVKAYDLVSGCGDTPETQATSRAVDFRTAAGHIVNDTKWLLERMGNENG